MFLFSCEHVKLYAFLLPHVHHISVEDSVGEESCLIVFLKQCSRAKATVNKTMNISKLSSPQHEKKAIVSQLKYLSLNWRMRAYDLPQKTLENDY